MTSLKESRSYFFWLHLHSIKMASPLGGFFGGVVFRESVW
jgi:hypothetical protein